MPAVTGYRWGEKWKWFAELYSCLGLKQALGWRGYDRISNSAGPSIASAHGSESSRRRCSPVRSYAQIP